MSKIQEITVPAGGQATIDFTAIPATYKHLVVVIVGRADAAQTAQAGYLQFNGDTSAAYDRESIFTQANAGAPINYDQFATAMPEAFYLPAASAPAGESGSYAIEIPVYAGTAFNKTYNSRGQHIRAQSTGQYNIGEFAGSWRNTAAINRVSLSLSAGNFAAGTIATLYGVDGPASVAPTAQAKYACRIPPSFGAEATGNYEMGQRFWSDFDGVITGIAFYKSPSDTATTHTVNLWADDGVTKIGTASTSGEAAGAGWQLATFTTPPPITKATFYRATVGLTTFRWEAGAGSVARTVGPLTIYADCYASPAGSYPTTTGTTYRYVTPILAVS